jgi:uncharacterized protein (TIGR03435 family)
VGYEPTGCQQDEDRRVLFSTHTNRSSRQSNVRQGRDGEAYINLMFVYTTGHPPGGTMTRAVFLATFIGMAGVVSAWQAPPPTFEVASVRPSPQAPPSLSSLGDLRLPPGRWRAMRLNLVQLIATAYPQYAFKARIVGGPAWVRRDLFDVDARMDPKITLAEVPPLVAQLLAERFALRTRTERRSMDVYLLKLARNDGRLGAGLTQSDPSCVAAKFARQIPPSECRGKPVGGGLNLATSQVADFLQVLAWWDIDRPVLDRTGLTDFFDFQLTYQCGPFGGRVGRPCGGESVSLFTALQEQAGLKLEPARELIDVLVIDAVEELRPN